MELSSFMKPLLKFVMTSALGINMPNDHHVAGDHQDPIVDVY